MATLDELVAEDPALAKELKQLRASAKLIATLTKQVESLEADLVTANGAAAEIKQQRALEKALGPAADADAIDYVLYRWGKAEVAEGEERPALDAYLAGLKKAPPAWFSRIVKTPAKTEAAKTEAAEELPAKTEATTATAAATGTTPAATTTTTATKSPDDAASKTTVVAAASGGLITPEKVAAMSTKQYREHRAAIYKQIGQSVPGEN